LQVPYESLKRTARERKKSLDELKGTLKQLKSAAKPSAAQHAVIKELEECRRQLQRLKRKLDDASVTERDDAQRCRARLDYLQALGRPARDAHIEWNRQRIDRILVDYMLRFGYLDAAAKLVKQGSLANLTDLHVFEGAQIVLASLARHECAKALKWCSDNSARLRKARSRLEFELRVQEFVELVRNGNMIGAISHARLHLTPWAGQYPEELQHAVALLAFKADTSCGPYAALLDQHRWVDLIELFKAELFRLHSLPPASLLEIHLQPGLSALKTPKSISDGCGTRDPLHLSTYRQLAENLPFAKHVHSKLICALTGEVMSEHNPPMALPNGYVYSEAGLKAMAIVNEGIVTCPTTGASYQVPDLRRVYIM
jgi:macrophage erythroblast attacher